jgi:hypothetical protein
VRSADPYDLPPLSPGEGGLPDSLSPPRTAQRTAPPPAAESTPRPSALWLVSGVLAAIILLALGVGLKQWVAGGPPPRARVSHAASGRSVTSEAANEARLRAEPPAPALGDAPALNAPLGAAASPALPAPSEVPSRSAADLVLPRSAEPARAVGAHASEQVLEPKPSRAAKKQTAKAVSSEPAKARRERAAGSLPDNPY